MKNLLFYFLYFLFQYLFYHTQRQAPKSIIFFSRAFKSSIVIIFISFIFTSYTNYIDSGDETPSNPKQFDNICFTESIKYNLAFINLLSESIIIFDSV